jgi:SAM-dependent methyltransferase
VRDDLSNNLREIRWLNRRTGGLTLALRTIMPLIQGRECSLLDVATGSGDIPLAVKQRAEHLGIGLRATGIDVSSDVLAEARRVAGSSLELIEGDARALPFEHSSFDVVSLCLALHHFDPEDAVTVLAEMWRVARVGIAVVDLRRGLLPYAGVWLLCRAVTRNRLTQHDGPLSVLRAYTPAEVEELSAAARLTSSSVRARGLGRLTLVARKDAAGA